MTTLRLTSILLVLGSLVSCATRSDEVDRHADCERMREHVIDMRVSGFDGVRTSDGKQGTQQRRTVRDEGCAT